MARLSNYLIGNLANPGFGGMLSQGLSSGMQGIGEAYAQKRQRHAMESMTSMLTQADPTDPNVVRSVLDVANQMNVDPQVALGMVNQQQGMHMQKQQAQRQQEAAVRAAEQHEWSKLEQDYRTRMRAEEQVQKKYTESVLKQIGGDYSKTEKAIESVPEKYRELARDSVQRQMQFETNRESLAESRRKREPIPEEVLEAMAKTPGMENAIEVYRKDPNSPNAKGILEYAYGNAHKAQLYSSPKTADRVYEYEIDNALKVIQSASDLGVQNPWGPEGLRSPIVQRGVNVPDGLQRQVAMVVAREARNGPVTKETIQNAVDLVTAAVASEGAEKGSDYPEELIQQAMAQNPNMSRAEVIAALKANDGK